MHSDSDHQRAAARDIDEHATSSGETVVCNLCGADDTAEVYRIADYRYETDAIEWPIVRCNHCGLTYLNPRPPAHAIWRYYPTHFYDRREASVLGERYGYQADYLLPRRTGSLLDIGCARGDWIRFMAGRGWDCTGLEPSPVVGDDNGLRIVHSAIEQAKLAERSFDVVTAWAVFEHFHDPLRAFHQVAQWLRPGGRLVLAVPNFASLASRWAYQEDVPRHLYFFSEASLRRYGKAAGLQLRGVVHDTRLFGGGARGLLGVRLYEALGGARRNFFRAMKLPTLERIRRYPLIGLLDLPLHALESLLLPDWLVCRMRLSGTIVATFEKSA